MILSLFGPDGVGKSTISESLRSSGWQVFSGTGVASWPDLSWHESLIARGIDESSLDSDSHFLEKVRRAHSLARKVESEHGGVVIDSDPLHKTLMHDYRRALPDRSLAQHRLRSRLALLSRLAGHEKGYLVHVYLQIDDKGDVTEQAQRIHNRLMQREKLAYFDPRSVEQTRENIIACTQLRNLLIEQGERVITITSDTSFSSDVFLNQIRASIPKCP
jgi:hypothetical protein